MERRGVDFISVPDSYYKWMRVFLVESGVWLQWGFVVLGGLVSSLILNDGGYLLQLFTKPFHGFHRDRSGV